MINCLEFLTASPYKRLARDDIVIDIEMTDTVFLPLHIFFVNETSYKQLDNSLRFTKNEVCFGGVKIRYEYIPCFKAEGRLFKMVVLSKLHNDKIVKSKTVSNIIMRFDTASTCIKFRGMLYERMKYIKDYEAADIDRSLLKTCPSKLVYFEI